MIDDFEASGNDQSGQAFAQLLAALSPAPAAVVDLRGNAIAENQAFRERFAQGLPPRLDTKVREAIDSLLPAVAGRPHRGQTASVEREFDLVALSNPAAPLFLLHFQPAGIDPNSRSAMREVAHAVCLSELATTGCFAWNPRTNQAFYSPRFITLLGFPAEIFNDAPFEWANRIHPEDFEHVYSKVESMLSATTDDAMFEYRFRDRSGQWHWVQSRALVARRGPDHEAELLVGVLNDITETRAQEARQHDLQQLLRHQLGSATEPGFWSWDLQTDEPWWSPSLYTLFGRTPGDGALAFLHRDGLFDRESQLLVTAALETCRERGNSGQLRVRLHRGIGKWMTAGFECHAVRDDSGTIVRLFGLIHPLDSERSDPASAPARGRLDVPVSVDLDTSGHLGTFTLDPRRGIFLLSEEAARILGHAAGQPVAVATLEQALGRESAHLARSTFLRLIREGKAREPIELEIRREDGTRLWIRCRPLLERKASGQLRIAGFIQDITRERDALKRASLISNYDPVTHLPNRKLLAELARTAASLARLQGQSLAVLAVSIDDFHFINESFGHAVGDELLRRAAVRLKEQFPTQTVGRYGGNTFMVLHGPMAPGSVDLHLQGQRAHDALSAQPLMRMHGLRVRCSVGVVTLEQLADERPEVANLLVAAEAALSEARAQGGNRVAQFEQAARARIVRRLSIEARLPGAIAREELKLQYLPQVRLDNQQLAGLEVSLSWIDEDGLALFPGEFMEVAEATGDILPIGRWMLDKALDQMSTWRDQGLLETGTRLGLRVYAAQLQQTDILQTLRRTCEEHQWPLQQLVLVVPAEALHHADDPTRQHLLRIGDAGMHVAVTDFGEAGINLCAARELPLAYARMSPQLVPPSTPSSEALVKALSGVCVALGSSLLAPCIEDQSGAQRLLELGCNEGEGLLFGTAMTARAAEQWLYARRQSNSGDIQTGPR